MRGDSSMPLPNTSPDMSPTPTTVKSSLWMSRPISRKCRFTPSQAPRAVMPIVLVVVAVAAAGGEGIAEPEAVIGSDAVGDVGEGRRCPCRRRPPGRDRRRRGERPCCGGTIVAADPVIGEVEQAADEGPIAGDARRLPGFAVARIGRRLTTKPPLAPTGTITAFFTVCAFIRPEDLGAEVLPPVGPADAAARHLAAAQVDALDPRAVDEDLDHRPRQRQVVDLPLSSLIAR